MELCYFPSSFTLWKILGLNLKEGVIKYKRMILEYRLLNGAMINVTARATMTYSQGLSKLPDRK